jgi:hypothetical protein
MINRGVGGRGAQRHAVRVDGKWVDDYSMAKLLD